MGPASSTLRTSRDLLDALLREERPAFEEIEAFVSSHPMEDVRLDYKSGRAVASESSKEFRRTLRQLISSYANAEGGVVLIGYSDPILDRERGSVLQPPKLDPAPLFVGKQELRNWARDVVADMLPYFGQPPVLPLAWEVEGGCVQAIAVRRAPSLVPCVDSRELRYFMRFGDSTIPAEPWLLTDLQLGRRQHPRFSLSVTSSCRSYASQAYQPLNYDTPSFPFSFHVDNDSLTHAPRVRLALVGLAEQAAGSPARHRVSQSLQEQIHVAEPRHSKARLAVAPFVFPGLEETSTQDIYPFESYAAHLPERWTLPSVPGHPARARIWLAAVAVMSEGHSPQWFQLRVEHRGPVEGEDPYVDIGVEPIWDARAVISADLAPLKAAAPEPDDDM